MNLKKVDWKVFLFFFLYTFILAGIGVLLSGGFNLDELNKPPLAPPAWVFPVVWTILYSAMSIAAYLVFVSEDIDRGAPLRLYLLQVIVNVLWPVFFFGLEWRLFAFFWLLLLLALIALTMDGFRKISRPAFYLMVPYFVWVLFAGYLNIGFYLLNK